MNLDILKKVIRSHWQIGVIILTVVYVVFSYRYIFYQDLNLDYLEDFYNHSQWVIPESPRVMGDGELYRYVAGKLLHGADPLSINPEAPPFGKYLYSLSIVIFKNPHIISPMLYTLSVYVFYLLLKKFYQDKKIIFLLTLIFSTSTILTTQIKDTGLDLPQMFFMILHLLFIQKIIHQKQIKLLSKQSIIAGISLGAFFATKAPLLLPILILYDSYMLFRSEKLKIAFPIFSIGLLIYIISYTQHFLLGNTFSSWIKSQLWIINFYKSSKLPKNPFSVISYLFTGYSWENKKGVYAPEWNLSWLIGFLLIFNSQKSKLSFKLKELFNIKILTILLILFFMFTPFSKRYVLILLPFLVLLLGQLRIKVLTIFTIIHTLHFLLFMQFEPASNLNHFSNLLSQRRYQDVYQLTTKGFKQQVDLNTFTNTLRKVDENLEVNSVQVDIKPPLFILINSSKNAPISIIRSTPIGEYQLNRELKIKNEHNNWFIDWDWQLVSPNYSLGDDLEMIVETVYGGDLITQDNRKLSWSETKKYIYIHGITDHNHNLLPHISEVTGVGIDQLRAKAVVLAGETNLVPIGFIGWNPKQESLDYILDSPNVVLEDKIGRMYPKGLQTASYINKIQALEQNHPQIFPITGGEINLIKNNQTLPIYKSLSQSGENVILTEKIHQVLDEDAVILL